MPARRRLARANLGRVCRWLEHQGMASPSVSAAARDPRRLDALVRALFGHWVTAYAESALAARYDAQTLRDRVTLETPELVAEALSPPAAGGPGHLFVGLHYGAMELAALYAARVGGVPVVGPMETVGDPALAAYFTRTRRALGVTILPIAGAAEELEARVRRGEHVALVADRPIGGVGSRVRLFGAPARLPAGPALLAVELGGVPYLISMRRSALGAWVGRVERLDVVAIVAASGASSRRERVRAVLDAQARAFERIVADAPEQWWTLLFRVWEDEA
jgi:KDO2-lipid IV(A) lauroyltransferase